MLCDRAWRYDGLGQDQRVGMAFNSTNLEHAVMSSPANSANVGPNPLFDIGMNEVSAILRAENYVIKEG